MKYEEFKEKILEELPGLLSDDFKIAEIIIGTQTKTNDTQNEYISIDNHIAMGRAQIYLPVLYDMMNEGTKTFKEIVEDIAEIAQQRVDFS